MGVDGRIFPVGTKPTDSGSMFSDDWFPIQVKQMDKVGRPDIDAFEAVMEREGPPVPRRPAARLLRQLRLWPKTPNRNAPRSTSERVESSSS